MHVHFGRSAYSPITVMTPLAVVMGSKQNGLCGSTLGIQNVLEVRAGIIQGHVWQPALGTGGAL